MKLRRLIMGACIVSLLLTSLSGCRSEKTPLPGGTASADPAVGTGSPNAGENKVTNYLSDPRFDTREALPRYDHDKSWAHRLGESSCCFTGDTLYFITTVGRRSYIFYCDIATGISGPLCGKPECAHNDETCNAYANQGFGLSIYDGKLYWLTGYDVDGSKAIYCANLDGTARAKVCTLSDASYKKVSRNRMLAFHRGYAIYGGGSQTVSDGVAHNGVFAFAISLTTGEEAVVLDEAYEDIVSPGLELVPDRDRLYLVTHRSVGGPEEYEDRVEIFKWDLKTRELTSIYDEAMDLYLHEAWATEDGLLLTSWVTGDVYRYRFGTGEMECLFDFNAGTEAEEGGMEFACGYLVNWLPTAERVPRMRVTDLKGDLVFYEELDIPDWHSDGSGYYFAGADPDNLYIRLQFGKGGTQRTAIYQIPLAVGGSVRELWSAEGK